MGGDFIVNDMLQDNQIFSQMNGCTLGVVKAMCACIKETGESKLFSANIIVDDPAEMIARGKYALSLYWEMTMQMDPTTRRCGEQRYGAYAPVPCI